MSKLNDALESEWDSAAWRASYAIHQKELTFGDHVAAKAMNRQVGGSHYKDMAIQPVDFCIQNKLGFCEGNVIKYVCRYKNKGLAADLQKAKHYIELLLEGLE